MKKIIGLSCGRKNAFSESFLKEAAMGAKEFGVETEIIRAMSLKVLPCKGCEKCYETGKCILEDDVGWILEKTCVEDAALIVSAPCYHIRANGIFTCINERMNHFFVRDMNILKKTRVGAIIGVGGGGYDAWTSLTLPMINIFVQETRVLVDQIQVNYCRMKEWNTWLMKDMPKEPHKYRAQDYDHDTFYELTAPQPTKDEFHKAATERARQLGRNVAKAMDMPIEEVQFMGEETPVSCPVCHCNVVVIPGKLPHIVCPVCSVRGTVSFEDGEMKVDWNKDDIKYPRFGYDGIKHHMEWLFANAEGAVGKNDERIRELAKQYKGYGNFIKP